MRVAVLLPVFNGAATIERTIRSLLEQTHTLWRLVLVDNNSTDNSVKIVQRLMMDADLEWTHLKCNQPGIVPALNKGLFDIMSTNTDLIARLDADDFWHPKKLEKQILFLGKNPEISILGTQISKVEGVYYKPCSQQMIYPTTDSEIKKMLLSGNNALAHPSVMFRKDILLRTGGYDNTYPIAEDYHLWLKSIPWVKFANLDEVLVDYTVKHNPKYNPKCPQLCCISMKTAIENLL